MAPLKKTYLEELARIQDRIHDLFEQALLASEYDELDGGLPGTWAPSVDVLETEDSFLVFAELPGVGRDDIQLQVKDRRLELSGRRPSLGENRNFLRMERATAPSAAPSSCPPHRRRWDHGRFRPGRAEDPLPKRTDGASPSNRRSHRRNPMPGKRSEQKYVMISVVAERYAIHPQTLRLYEREGLIKPARSAGNTRLYDEEAIRRLEIILTLTRELGVNLAGVEVILNMKERMEKMQVEVDRLLEYVKREAERKNSSALVKLQGGPLSKRL